MSEQHGCRLGVAVDQTGDEIEAVRGHLRQPQLRRELERFSSMFQSAFAVTQAGGGAREVLQAERGCRLVAGLPRKVQRIAEDRDGAIPIAGA